MRLATRHVGVGSDDEQRAWLGVGVRIRVGVGVGVRGRVSSAPLSTPAWIPMPYSVPAGDAGERRTAVELSTMSVAPDSARMRNSSDSRSLPPRAPIVQIAAAAGWAGCVLALRKRCAGNGRRVLGVFTVAESCGRAAAAPLCAALITVLPVTEQTRAVTAENEVVDIAVRPALTKGVSEPMMRWGVKS